MSNKVQYNGSFGLDFDQIIGWQHKPSLYSESRPSIEEHLELYTTGNTVIVTRSNLGQEGFDNLLQYLRTQFELFKGKPSDDINS
jgi:hypothetical protein